MQNIVVTGASRGIGYGLAHEFLLKGHRLTISGQNKNNLEAAVERLKAETKSEFINFVSGDVSEAADIEKLWLKAEEFGKVDIWVNNAGMGQDAKYLTELDNKIIERIIDVNLKGMMLCSKYAYTKMIQQGSGAIYNMEGFGSDGRKMEKMIVYGTTKSALRYFTRSLAIESKKTPVIVATISPGMVVTDLLIGPVSKSNATSKEAIKIFNILSDRVETVTPWLVQKMLSNTKNGASFNWLSSRKVMWRFIKNMFVKRKVKGLPELS